MTDGKTAYKTAVALGNFDGMHVGHTAVLREAKSFEKEGLLPVAVLFDEHSLKKITGEAPPALMTATERDRIIKESGLEIRTLVFGEIMKLSPRDFVKKILLDRLNAGAVCCGYNYRFGRSAAGTSETMKSLCKELQIKCSVAGEVDVDSEAVSSTEIRRLIESGEIERANRMLGRRFGFSAKVIDGDKRGRTLGFPTINQEIPSELVMPRFGVYKSAVTVDGKEFVGVTNIGRRPTVGTEKILSETHILGFDKEIYGIEADIRLVKFIRPEKKFYSFDELARQIESDAKEVR